MKPVFQTRFGYPNGNCWEACLASLLEIPIDQVPDWRPQGRGRPTWEQICRWLAFEHPHVALTSLQYVGLAVPLGLRDQHYILCGTSARGLGHAVIGHGGEVVHNPNPDSRAALVSVDRIDFLVPVVAIPRLVICEGPTDEEMAAVMTTATKHGSRRNLCYGEALVMRGDGVVRREAR